MNNIKNNPDIQPLHSTELLLVSSRRNTIEFLQKSLQKDGRRLILCNSGGQALDLMQKREFALVLIELPLYDINVYDMLATANLNNNFKQLIILISPFAIDTEEMLKGYSLGIMDYFIKPIDLNILLFKIQSYCEIFQYRKTIQQTNIRLIEEKNASLEKQGTLKESVEILDSELENAKNTLNTVLAQRNETEKQLKIVKDKYQDIFENTIEGIFQTTQEGRYLQVNRSLAKIYGYQSAEEMLTVLNDIENQLYVDPLRRQEFKRRLEEKDILENFESQVFRKDGSIIWIKENARAVRDSNRKLLYYEGTVTDITKRKVAIETIISTNKASSRFVPHQFLQLLEKSSIIDLNLSEHTQKKMSVLFSDIRSFTTLSEKITPIENFRFLNAFFSRMGPIIRKNNGFIDKYIGDSIMALFNEAQDAFKAAQEMLGALEKYNVERNAQGEESIKIGIGINTGEVILGMIGEEHRIEGTVIGNTVNTASRIEQLTKKYNLSCLIGQNTFDDLNANSQHLCRFIDKTYVKGKNNKVTVFEVFAHDFPEIQQLKIETKSLFEKARLLDIQGKKADSHQLLRACLQKNAEDSLAHYFLNENTDN